MLPLLPAVLAALPTLDEPLRTGAAAPEDAAVVVGFEDYAFLPAVAYARADAQAFADWLLYSRGLAPDRVTLLSAGTAEDVLAAVQRARGLAGADGTVWVYYAGHGTASTTDRRLLLLGDDARPTAASLDTRGVALEEVGAAASAGGHAVVVVDACQSGTGRDGAALLPGARPALPVEELGARADLVLWTSTSPGQLATPLPEVGHGAFTWLLVGALRGWADGERGGGRDGAVTLEEARAYVDRSLRTAQVDQQPSLRWEGDPSRELLLRARGLESGPPASALPRLAALPTPLPALPDTQATLPPELAGLRPPFTHTAGRTWADPAGRAVAFADLAEVAQRRAEGEVAVRRLRTSGLAPAGLTVVAVGLVGMGELVRASAHHNQENYEEGSPWADEPAMKGLVVGNLMFWGGLAGEAAVLGVHLHRTRRLRAQIVDLAEQELR